MNKGKRKQMESDERLKRGDRAQEEPTAAQEKGKRVCFMKKARSEIMAGEICKSRENRRRKGVRKMTISGSKFCPTWRQVSHTSTPLTQEPRSRKL